MKVNILIVVILARLALSEGFKVSEISSPSTSAMAQRNCSYVQGLYANLIRFVSMEGFHRELEDVVEVTVTNSIIPFHHFNNGDCTFAILGTFNADVFVDPYEVNRNVEYGRNIYVLNDWTDLESPSWLARSNSTVFIQLQTYPTGNLISTVEVKVPLQFRYQRPTSHSRRQSLYGNKRQQSSFAPLGYKAVSLPLPQLLFRCKNWDHQLVEEQCPVIQTMCYEPVNCSWISLPFKSNSKGSIVFLPVGDVDQKLVISSITVIVILGGMTFLLVTLIGPKLVDKPSRKTD